MRRREHRARQPSQAAAAAGVLVDTGALVALFDRNDPHHVAVETWLAGCDAALHTVEAVLAEACFFLPARLRPALARLVTNGVIRVHPLDAAAHGRLAELFDKYRDHDPDWPDMAPLWLAETSGLRRIATLDVGDFGVYRIHGRLRFELELLR